MHYKAGSFGFVAKLKREDGPGRSELRSVESYRRIDAKRTRKYQAIYTDTRR